MEAKDTCPASLNIPEIAVSWESFRLGIANHNSTGSKQLSNNTDFMWQKISSIKHVGEEEVFDIEVEGTHNFVAGHILRKMENGKWTMDKDAEAEIIQNNSQFSILHSQFIFGGIIAHNTEISGGGEEADNLTQNLASQGDALRSYFQNWIGTFFLHNCLLLMLPDTGKKLMGTGVRREFPRMSL